MTDGSNEESGSNRNGSSVGSANSDSNATSSSNATRPSSSSNATSSSNGSRSRGLSAAGSLPGALVCVVIGLLVLRTWYAYLFSPSLIGPGADSEDIFGRFFLAALLVFPVLPALYAYLKGGTIQGGHLSYTSSLQVLLFVCATFCLYAFSKWQDGSSSSSLRFLGWSCLLLTCILVFMAFLHAGDFFGFRKKGGDASRELRERPLVSVVLFISFFMWITYYIGFCLAFFDKSAGSGVGRVLYSPESYYAQGGEDDGAAAGNQSAVFSLKECDYFGGMDKFRNAKVNRHRIRDKASSAADGEEYFFVFWVEDGDNELFVEDAYVEQLAADNIGRASQGESNGNELSSIEVVLGRQLNGASMEVKNYLGLMNGCALFGILSEVYRQQDSLAVEVIIESYVTTNLPDKDSPENPYWAEHRVFSTIGVISEGMSRFIRSGRFGTHPELKWRQVPRHTQYRQLGAQQVLEGANGGAWGRIAVAKGGDSGEEPLLTPIKVAVKELPNAKLPVKGNADLSLLDYMYFSIYTITTTGYGDIVPISPISRFVTSIANLIELFFVVIFFNVLTTLVVDEREKEGVGLG